MLHFKAGSSLIIALLVLFFSSLVSAAPASELWGKWASYDINSNLTIDHSEWNDLTHRFVTPSKDGINRLAYSKFQQGEKKQLQAYILSLSKTPIRQYNRDEQKSYWINLYNAVTINLILDNYPIASIREIESGFFSFGPWDKELIMVEGEKISLNDIEHRILRPIWKDPRIHYAVNCASIGCPNLQSKAFTAENAEALLNLAAVEFINHARAVKVKNNKLRVSSIYNWYKVDFGGTDVSIINHLRQYAKPELAEQLSNIGSIDNDDHYNWSINSLSSEKLFN
jgi:hypothetical protein|tara:strand:- start:2402 stop:3250 length:849 start_codon:yes stop_codon:yes gene_type:complete